MHMGEAKWQNLRACARGRRAQIAMPLTQQRD